MATGSSIRAMKRIALPHSGHWSGSLCHACRMRSRDLRLVRLVGGGGDPFGQVAFAAGLVRLRQPRLLLEYGP